MPVTHARLWLKQGEWRSLFFCSLVFLSFNRPALAHANGVSPASPSLSKTQDIFLFDTSRITDAKILLDAKKQLDALNDLLTKKFSKEEERFKKSYDQLMSSQKTLSTVVFQEQQQILKKRFENFQSKMDFKHRQIQLAYRKIMDRVQAKLHQIIERIAQSKKAKYVFVKGVCVWFAKDLKADMTGEVMAILDRETPPEPIVLPSEEEVRSSGLFSSLLSKENSFS